MGIRGFKDELKIALADFALKILNRKTNQSSYYDKLEQILKKIYRFVCLDRENEKAD
jgi:hypothetical protein